MVKAPKFCPECGADWSGIKICEKCGYEIPQGVESQEKKILTPTGEGHPNWPDIETFVSELGKWAWLIAIFVGILYFLLGITSSIIFWITPTDIWYIIGGLIVIILGIIIVKPKFSDKCASRDWDFLLNHVLILGNFRIPWMLIWGIIIEVFGNWWGGLPIIIPALLLILMGPKPYNWTTE